MLVTKEVPLIEFQAWGGAADTLEELTAEQIDEVERNLMDMHPEGMTEEELNDFLAKDYETIAGWFGYKNYCAMIGAEH